jgi:hypothetical protein
VDVAGVGRSRELRVLVFVRLESIDNDPPQGPPLHGGKRAQSRE